MRKLLVGNFGARYFHSPIDKRISVLYIRITEVNHATSNGPVIGHNVVKVKEARPAWG
jgi:hypothetical protein